MSAGRVLGFLLLIAVIIVAIAVIWHVGSQKIVYDLPALGGL